MKRSHDPWVILLLAIGGILLFSSLGNGRLWQDEAETAVLGKNILRFGYPSAWDGVNRLNPSLRVQEGYAWTYHSWLPMYLAGSSFGLFGADTVSARLPFAILGLFSLWLAYRLFERLTGDGLIAHLGLLFLVTSVPFLLHMRQCRYYAPAVFFTLWATWAYLRFCRCRPGSGLELFMALTLLFHADHGAFVPVFAALGIHFLWNERTQWRRGLALSLAVCASLLPWVIYLEALQHHKHFSWLEIRHHAQFYFRQVNRFLVPIVFWAALLLFWRHFRKMLAFEMQRLERWEKRLWLSFVGVGLFFLIFLPEQRHFRYLIFLVPFLLVLQALLLRAVLRHQKGLGIALMAFMISTDFFHYSAVSLKVRSLPLEFLGELTHPYQGPVDGVIELLESHAHPGQTLKIPYEEHPILFYTALQVEPIVKPEDFARQTFPDWIVLRRDWLPAGFLESPYYREIKDRYEEILLDAPDIPWQNRPDPGYHRFRTDSSAPRVIAFKKRN